MQEREYKEALEAFNEKNREKVQLITKLMEVSHQIVFDCLVQLFKFVIFFHSGLWSFCFVTLRLNGSLKPMIQQLVGESEKVRMKKLEELSKNIDSIH